MTKQKHEPDPQYSATIAKFTQGMMVHAASHALEKPESIVANAVEISGQLVYNGVKAMNVFLISIEAKREQREDIKKLLHQIIDTAFGTGEKVEAIMKDLDKKSRGASKN